MLKYLGILTIILLSLMGFRSQATAPEYTIKFATVAPDGSAWMNVMKEYDAALRKESGGKLGFKFYAGGVAGDEKDVLRKIRIGEYQAAGFTGVGMGEIASEERVLDTPFLFHSTAEIDYIYDKFTPEFSKAFEQGGFVFLGWAEPGFVYVFTQKPVYSVDDMQNVKAWMWEGDPIAEVSFKVLKLAPIPLSIADVNSALQTGMINCVYSPPLAIIPLQWFTKMKYMLDVPLANSTGAALISKKYFDTLPQDLQQLLVKDGQIYLAKLTQLSREENVKAIQTLESKGITVTHPRSGSDLAYYYQTGEEAREMLVGRLYTADLLQRVESALADFRKEHKEK
ncbi:MAG TPA: TRAP transporter substrate-binding protein DctP [Candidatus Kryptonia bacterium]